MTDTSPNAARNISQKKSSSRTTIIIVFMAVIIIVQGIFIFLGSQQQKETKEVLTTTEQELATTRHRMEEIRNELDLKIAEVTKLGGSVADLEKAKAEVEAELKRSVRATGKEIKALKDKVEGYELLLRNKDEEIDKLKSVNKELLTENRTLKTQKNSLADTINQLSQTKQELANKVAIASQLKAENIHIVALNNRDKERESPFKNRQITKLKIDFNLAENEVAPVEGKKILIRVIDENGQVLFDVARGSGTFMYNGKEEFFTAAQEILFDNTKQRLSFIYEKGSDYAPGNYIIEIYADDYSIGKGQFQVK
jgi:peptidoglycan hydrolase CwlO-like protein